MQENNLLHISKCTANAKILFPVYFLYTSFTSAYFVLWAGLCLLIKEIEAYSKTRDSLEKG